MVPGQQVGLSGNTGTLTTGPHVHFSVWAPGVIIPNFGNNGTMDPEQTINPLMVLPFMQTQRERR